MTCLTYRKFLVIFSSNICSVQCPPVTCEVKVAQLCPTLCDPMDCSLPGSPVHVILQARILEKRTGQLFPSPRALPNPRIEPRFPALQGDSSPFDLPGKPKNTGVNSHFLLQGIFPTQGLNSGLLHYRRILYQLRYQGSPQLHVCYLFIYFFTFHFLFFPIYFYSLEANVYVRPFEIVWQNSGMLLPLLFFSLLVGIFSIDLSLSLPVFLVVKSV